MERRDEQVQGLPGVGIVAGLELGHPAPLGGLGRCPLRGDELEAPPVVGDGEVLVDDLDRGHGTHELGAGGLAAGDRHGAEPVLLHDADRRDLEADHLGDALGDQLEGVAGEGIGPLRAALAHGGLLGLESHLTS